MGAVTSKKKEYRIESVESAIDVVEKVVCREDDLRDGEMKEFDLGQGKVLLIKEKGAYTALGSKCTHYGAPLIKGVLKGGTIRCPWHGACFNSSNGDIEDFPGLDSLPCFNVSVCDGNVKVKADAAALKSQKRFKPVVRHIASSVQTFVVVGGGGAAQSCVETLRQNGFSGKLIMISKEQHFPYDRPKLSKALDAKPEDLYLRNQEFYRKVDVSVMSETEVTGIDTEQQWITCDNGKLMVKYDSLMIATGGRPVKLNVPGNDLKNVYLLRTPEDGNQIAKNVVGKAVVLIGSSFIAMEVASYLLTKARSINIISRSDVPFKASFGEVIGKRIKKMFEEKGVVFHSDNQVVKFLGNDGYLTSVELESKDVLQADICVVGIGVRPSTDFLKCSNISMTCRNLVHVNEYLETNVSNVFACGDIVEFPLKVLNDQRVNISHWQMAMSHGRTAALNLLGHKQVLKTVPFFWCVMCSKSFRYAGYGAGFDDVVINGSVDDLQFAAYYCKDDKVVAICTVNSDPEAALFASHMLSGSIFSKNEIKNGLPH